MDEPCPGSGFHCVASGKRDSNFAGVYLLLTLTLLAVDFAGRSRQLRMV